MNATLFRRRLRLIGRWARDLSFPTLARGQRHEGTVIPLNLSLPVPTGTIPDGVVGHYLDHEFDILGSGWTQVRYGMKCRGVDRIRHDTGAIGSAPGRKAVDVNRVNRTEAAHVRSLLSDGYVPIDWHLDFKSGYRWSESTWYRRVRTAPVPGADIKVPWELARMQHLPQLALARACPASAHYSSDAIPIDFRNQLIDFIASNPPRFGVNWKCTMDVGIRAVNWVLAYSLLTAQGVAFDVDFLTVLTSSLRQHAHHIATNLEWVAGRRANHYLGNLAGLIFCAAVLPRNDESDAWLAFGIRELNAEMDYQFLPDGGHFEGSAPYHRFALEMVTFPAAVILGLDVDRLQSLSGISPASVGGLGEMPLPSSFFAGVERARDFLREMRAPDGSVVQIGDNDSGRLCKLSPVYECMTVREARDRYANLTDYDELPDDASYWFEHYLETASVLDAADALLSRPGRNDFGTPAGQLVAALIPTGRQRPESPRPSIDLQDPAHASQHQTHVGLWERGEPAAVRTFQSSGSLTDGLELHAFPDFGCYAYRSPRLYMLVRCWTRAPRITAHLHNDQLGLILWLDGSEILTDPGTYLYTPAPAMRDMYRSVQAHDTPWPRGYPEPAGFASTFAMRLHEPGRIIRADPRGFEAEFSAHGVTVARRIHIRDASIAVEDWGPAATAAAARPVPVSPGYGIRRSFAS